MSVNPVTLGIPDQENSETDRTDNPTNRQGPEPHAPLPPAGRALRPPPPPHANEQPSKWRENTKFGLEIFGLAVLITYTVFSCLQWLQIRCTNRLTREALNGSGYALQQSLDKMQGQIDQMHELATQAGKQADSTKKSADAAKQAADIAKEALVRSERPWMTLERGPTIKIGPDGAETLLVVRNVGRSPALHMSYYMEPLSLDDAYTDSKTKSERFCHFAEAYIGVSNPTLPSLGAVLFPDKIFTLHDTREITGDVKAAFAIMGCLAYVDQFYDSPVKSGIHHTGFCFYYTPDQELKKPVSVDMTLTCNFGQIGN